MSSSAVIQQNDSSKVGSGAEDLKTPTKPLDSTGTDSSPSNNKNGQNTNQSASFSEAPQENKPSNKKLANGEDSLDELDTPKEQDNNQNPKEENNTSNYNNVVINNTPATKNNTSNEFQQQPSLSLSTAQLASSSSFCGSLSLAVAASPQAKTKKNTTASPEVVQAVEEHTLRSNTRAISASPTPRDASASPICKSLITLHYATDADMAEYMLSKGADIEALDKGGVFFVGVADQPNNKYEAANARPASPTRKRATTTSPSATLNRTFDNASGSNNEDEKFIYQRPLHTAAQAGRWDVAYVLLLNGAQVNAMTTGDIQVTPLDYAIENLHFDVFDLLKAQGGQRTVASFSRMLARGLDEIALKKLEREYRRKKALEEGKELSDDDEEVVEFKLLDDVHAASPPTKSLQDNDDEMDGKRAGSAPATMKGKEKNKFVIDFSKEFRPDLVGARKNAIKRKSQQREKSADDARRNNKREESTKQGRDSKKNSPENNNSANEEGKTKQDKAEDESKKETSPKTSQQSIKNEEIDNDDDDDRRDARLVEIIEKQLREQEQRDALEASLKNNNEQQHQQPPSNSSATLNQTQTDFTVKKDVDHSSQIQHQEESKKQQHHQETLSSPNPQDPNIDKNKNNTTRKETPQKRENQTKNNNNAQFENSFHDGFLDAALGKKGGPRLLPAHHETPQVMKRKQQQEERRKEAEEEKETGSKQQKPAATTATTTSRRASSSNNLENKNNIKSRFDSPTASSNLKRTNSNFSNSTANTNTSHNKRAATPTHTKPPQRQQQNRTSSTNSNTDIHKHAISMIPHFTGWPDSIKVTKGTSSWARSTTPRMPIQIEVARGLYLPMNQVPDRAGGRRSLTEHELERERQEQIKRHKEILEEHEKGRKLSSGDANNDEIQQQQPEKQKRKSSTSNFVPLTPHLRRDADIVEYILDKPLTPDEVAKQRALNDRLATPRQRASATAAKKRYTIDDDDNDEENKNNGDDDDDDDDESETQANPPWNGRHQVDDSPASSRLGGRRLSPKQKRESYEAEKAVYMENAKKVKEEREKEKMERVLRIKNFEQEMRMKKQQQQQQQQQQKQNQQEEVKKVEDEARRNETAENENAQEPQHVEKSHEQKKEEIHPPWNARAKMDPSPSLFSADHIRQIREQQQKRTNSQTRSSQQRNIENSKKPSSLFLPSTTNSEQPQRTETEQEAAVKPNKNEEQHIDEPPRQEQENNQTINNKQHQSESNVKKNTLRGRDVVAITFGNKNVNDNTKRDTPTRRTTNNSAARNSTPTRRPLTATSASLKNEENIIKNDNNDEATGKKRNGTPIYLRQNTNNNNNDNEQNNKASNQNQQQQNRQIIHVSPSGRVSDPSISTTLAMHPNAAPRAMDQISFLAFGNAPFSAMPVQRIHSNTTHSPSKQRTSTPTRGGVQTSVKDEEILGKPRWHN